MFDSGKSALHWAAAVNNIEALTALLRAGANRDAQTEREETPLFLAAREGSYEAVRVLLDHFANRDVTDHMDRYIYHKNYIASKVAPQIFTFLNIFVSIFLH